MPTDSVAAAPSSAAEVLAHARERAAAPVRKERSKSRMGSEELAITRLQLEKNHDYRESAHEGSISEPPKLLARESFDVDGLVGIGLPAGSRGSLQEGMEARPAGKGSGAADKLEPIQGSATEAAAEAGAQQLEVEVYIRCEDILATRGTKTDSFVRIILIEDDTMAEHEVGKTEVVDDTLDPKYRHPIQLKFRLGDEQHRLRIELCDPGESNKKDAKQEERKNSKKSAAGQADGIVVLGAILLTLQELIAMVGIGGELSRRSAAAEASTPRGKAGKVEQLGVSRFELKTLAAIEQEQRQNKRQNRASASGAASPVASPTGSPTASPSALRNSADSKPAGLGRLVLVPEIISADQKYCWFVLGASNLRTENLSFPPSPFLKIFRMLADGTKAPVYETGHVRSVRDCAWKTVPIPLQRLHNGDPLRSIVLEVWDYGDMGGNYLVGTATMHARQLLQSATAPDEHGNMSGPQEAASAFARNVPLLPPSSKQKRRGTVSAVVGFGRARSPGSLQVLRSEIDFTSDQAMTVFKTFDVDSVRHEAMTQAAPVWTTLAERYDKVVEEKQLGLRTSGRRNCLSSCCGCVRRWRAWLNATSLSRIGRKYDPFHYVYLSIGARFGSGIQSLFGFASTLIELNVLLSLVWCLFVNLPQLLLNDSAWQLQQDVNATITSAPIHASAAPSLIYFGGYKPAYYKEEEGNSDVAYPMDVFYFLCATLGTVGVSLLWLVLAISAMLRQRQGQGGGASAVGQMVDLVFNGWDMLETTKRATDNMRNHIRVHLEHKHEELRRAAHTKQAKSRKQVRDLLLKRAFFVFLSALLLVASISLVVLTLSVYRQDVERFGTDYVADAFGEILPSLIVTAVNTVSPILIKSFVRFEEYNDPEVELRQQIGRIFLIKMLNLVVTAFTLASASLTIPAYSEADYMAGCAESAAGKTYVQLIFSDAVFVIFLSAVPKFVLYYLPYVVSCGHVRKCGPFGHQTLIDLPKEVMELVYRQALIWVAALYVPLIYPIGVVAHVSVFFVKYLSFRGLYKAPLKPFSRTKVTRLFLSFAFASLLAVVLPFSSAMVQTANSFCGPLRARECALLPHNETCGVARLNYDALNDELMTGSEVSFSSANISAISGLDGLASAAGSLATNLSSCGFSCVLKFFIDAIFSTATLLVVSVLLCIVLNFTRARLKQLRLDLETSEQQRAEEHADKVRLLRRSGVKL